MIRLTDPAGIGPLLDTDRVWSAYALGDLSPPHWDRSEWFCVPGEPPTLALLYRGFFPPVLFTLGPADRIATLIEAIHEPAFSLSVRPEVVPLLESRYTVEGLAPMWRMVLDSASFQSCAASGTRRLQAADTPALLRLYQDGAADASAPDAFDPEMVEAGVFFGMWEDGELVAAAGTHLVAPSESVAAVGNVYTRRDRRGAGLGRRVTAAVTAELVRMGLRTIVLNVQQRNEAAVRLYERLGYRRYCAFIEGLARWKEPG